jgi:amidase
MIRTLLAAALALMLAVSTPFAAPQRSAAADFNVMEATIAGIHRAFESRTLTCVQLVGLYLDRIRAYEDGGPRLNSVTTVNPKALEVAAELDAHRTRSGMKGPLHCIPVLLKDNIDTADMPTTNGSVILKGSIPPDDARIVTALKEAGALILGKAAMGEFAGGSYNTVDGQTLNPYHFSRATGGSSSGSGAAVSANFSVLGVGTDTSTSVRGPSAFTGIVGLRPTTGLVSRDGIAPKNLNFDTAGPMARTVTDVATMLNALAGSDPADPLSVEVFSKHPDAAKGTGRYGDFTRYLRKEALKGARLGVVLDFFGGDPEIDALARDALAKMKALGAELVDVRLDPQFLEFYVTNGGRNIRRIADYRFRKDWEAYLATLGPSVPKTTAEFVRIYETEVARSPLPVEASVLDLLKRGIATSTEDPAYRNVTENVLPAATKLKLAIYETYKVDALVFPYQPAFAAPIQNPVRKVEDPSFVPARGRPQPAILAGYSSIGFPGIVVPMGFGSQGLPMAISFMGRPYEEGRILGYAYAYEQATMMRRPSPLLPPLSSGTDQASGVGLQACRSAVVPLPDYAIDNCR